MKYLIKCSTLGGSITIPPSKSHTLRAILFAAMAKGQSIIYHYLSSPDTHAMINACRALGAQISVESSKLIITGTNGKLTTPKNEIDAGNSGQVLRFITALVALLSDPVTITGDDSICNNRPIQPLLHALNQLDVSTHSKTGYAPVTVQGPLQGGTTTLNGEDSQPVSGLLIAAAFAKNPISIHVENPGETPWIDLTLAWLRKLNIPYQQKGYTDYFLPGNASYSGFEYTVPGDFSSCAFSLVAALITHSEITLNNLDMTDVQGDKLFISILQELGAIIEISHPTKQLHIKKSPKLMGGNININNCIDALPILAVLSCFSTTETFISGAAIARKKESNRLFAISHELKKFGAEIAEHTDGLIVQPSQLTNAHVQSHHDHRIAMSLAIAALATQGETCIENTHCVAKSYPNFVDDFRNLGAHIEVIA